MENIKQVIEDGIEEAIEVMDFLEEPKCIDYTISKDGWKVRIIIDRVVDSEVK